VEESPEKPCVAVTDPRNGFNPEKEEDALLNLAIQESLMQQSPGIHIS